jgi:hypothetical protein
MSLWTILGWFYRSPYLVRCVFHFSYCCSESPIHSHEILAGGASAVSYVGYKRSNGSAYGICIDCGAGGALSTLRVVDGNDPMLTDDSEARPVCIPPNS